MEVNVVKELDKDGCWKGKTVV